MDSTMMVITIIFLILVAGSKFFSLFFIKIPKIKRVVVMMKEKINLNRS